MSFLNKLFGTKTNLTFVSMKESEDMGFSNAITPAAIKMAITKKRNEGILADLDKLFDILIDSDDNLAADIDTRTEALKSKIPDIPAGLTPKQNEYFSEILKKLYPDLVNFLINAKLKGYNFAQIRYELTGGLYYPVEIVTYQNIDLRISNRKLELYQNDNKKNTDDPRFLKLLRKRSILQSLLKYYTFKSFALNNWASFTEIFGKPIRVGKYKPGATKDEKDELWNMLKNAGTDLAAMVSENVIMEFIDYTAKSASADLYNNLVSFCSKSVTKRILGQTLATDAQKTGSYAQAKVHNLVRLDILAGDARDCDVFISKFFTTLNRINFNNDEIFVTTDISDPPSLKDEIDIDIKLQNSIGIELDDDYFYQKYKRPRPGELKKKL